MATSHAVNSCRIQSVYRHALEQEPFLNCEARQKEGFTAITQVLSRIFLSAWNSSSIYANELGMVTAVALLLVAVLTLLGTTAVVITSTDLLIGGNYKVSEQAFYAAEAGVEEAKARLRESAVAGVKINDTAPNSPDWKVYIGTLAMAQARGFNPSSLSQSRVDSRQVNMSYVVEIKHRVNAANQVMYWDGVTRTTTPAKNIYLVTSTGFTGNANRAVQAELTRNSPAFPKTPLYVKSPTKVSGNQTTVDGTNVCGSSIVPAVTTTLAQGSGNNQSVEENGGPNITGDPRIKYLADSLDVDALLDSLKPSADITPTDPSVQGANWGDPTNCSTYHIVYFNTDAHLTGQSQGCGLLLVDGDLEVNGGFQWRGQVIATGGIKFTGKGGDSKKVTGGMISGGSVDADVTIGGSTEIRYCSTIDDEIAKKLPMRFLSWRDENQK
jgi:Tfp pilus assembly protein PilX